MKRGEIWWYEEPTMKRRPYLVLTRDEAIPVLQRVLAVPATGRLRGIRSEVRLGPEDGMPVECALSLDNLTVVPKHLFTSRICSLDSVRMEQVCEAFQFASGC